MRRRASHGRGVGGILGERVGQSLLAGILIIVTRGRARRVHGGGVVDLDHGHQLLVGDGVVPEDLPGGGTLHLGVVERARDLVN